MTTEDHAKLIHDTIHDAFAKLYPHHNIVIHGAGEELITVAVQYRTEYIIGFEFEVPSDDDGYFYFKPTGDDQTTAVSVLIPYPEGLGDVE